MEHMQIAVPVLASLNKENNAPKRILHRQKDNQKG